MREFFVIIWLQVALFYAVEVQTRIFVKTLIRSVIYLLKKLARNATLRKHQVKYR